MVLKAQTGQGPTACSQVPDAESEADDMSVSKATSTIKTIAPSTIQPANRSSDGNFMDGADEAPMPVSQENVAAGENRKLTRGSSQVPTAFTLDDQQRFKSTADDTAYLEREGSGWALEEEFERELLRL